MTAISTLNEDVVELGRKAGLGTLEAYESTVQGFADQQVQLAEATDVEWVAKLVRAQADVNRDVARVYAEAARGLLVK